MCWQILLLIKMKIANKYLDLQWAIESWKEPKFTIKKTVKKNSQKKY